MTGDVVVETGAVECCGGGMGNEMCVLSCSK
jgi:hypothetical protein